MISVVIPAYNEEKALPACLEQFTKQTIKEPFEIILVDNNSTDRTVEIAKSFLSKLNLRIIHEKTKGRGPARRAGFAAAKGEFILSTDADTLVPPEWVEQLAEGLKSEDVIAVSGQWKVTDCDPMTNFLATIPRYVYKYFYQMILGFYWLNGFNFGIKKSIYEKVDGFHPTLVGQEDADLSLKVARMGKKRFLNVTVICSGRRFKNGYFRGMYSYLKTTIQYFIFKEPIDFTDPR